MSYILDALRRADSERERGSVPGLHAQPVPAQTRGDAPAGRGRTPRWPWIALGIAGGALLPLLAWRLASAPPAPEPAPLPLAAAPAPAATPPAAQTLPPLPPAPAPAAPRPAAPPRAAPPAAETTPPARRAAPTAAPSAEGDRAVAASPAPAGRSAPEPWTPPADSAGPAVKTAPASAGADATAGRAAAGTVTAAAAPAVPPAAAGTAARVPTLAELPPEIRRQLPALAIGGSIYSDDPRSRFLIINGQTFREKDRVLPELTLERIALKSAVLDFKGHRFGISY